MTRPNIPPDQLVAKIVRIQADQAKATSQANRAFDRFMEDTADEQRLTIWQNALNRVTDLVEEESRLVLMREEWKTILKQEQSELEKDILSAKLHLTKLTSRQDRNAEHLNLLYFG